MCIFDIASIQQVRDHTKLRSGSLVTFVISHRQTNLEIVYRTLVLEIDAFCADPLWGSKLVGDPVLCGIKRTSALGCRCRCCWLRKLANSGPLKGSFNAGSSRPFIVGVCRWPMASSWVD